jgi:fumarate hydratase class II
VGGDAGLSLNVFSEATLKLGYLTGEDFDSLVKPEKMTRP